MVLENNNHRLPVDFGRIIKEEENRKKNDVKDVAESFWLLSFVVKYASPRASYFLWAALQLKRRIQKQT